MRRTKRKEALDVLGRHGLSKQKSLRRVASQRAQLLLLLRISSVAGMLAAVSAPVTAAVVGDDARLPLLIGLALLVVWKHRENIRRLIAGEEPRVGRAKA